MFGEKIILKIIKYLIFACLAVPLVYSSSFLYPYIFLKNIIFRILAGLAMIFYVWLIAKNKDYFPRKNFILIGFSLFLFVALASSLVNPGFYFSFFDGFERMEGVVNFIYLFLFFLVLTSVFKKKEDWLLLFRWNLIINLLIAVYAVLQKFNLDFIIHSQINRVDSLIGNPSFLATYLLLGVFIGFYVLENTQKLFEKFFYWLIIILNLSVIFLAKTRGVILALLFSLALWAIVYFIKNKKYKKVIPVLVLAIILITSVYVVFQTDKISEVWRDTTARNRLTLWQISWQGFLDKPVLGWGAGNFDAAFNKYYTPELSEPYFDHAHNIVLDTLVKFGFLGLLAYLAIFAGGFGAIIRAYQNKKLNFNESFIWGVLLIAYFIQNLFLFDSINNYIMFVLVIGYLSILAGGKRFGQAETGHSVSCGHQVSGGKNYLNILLVIIILLFGYSLVFYNIRPALAGYYVQKAARNDIGDIFALAKNFKKAAELDTFGRPDIARLAAQAAVQGAGNQSLNLVPRTELFDLAVLENGKSIKANPQKMRPYLNLALLYLYNSDLETDNLAKAKNNLEKVSQLAPGKMEVHDLLSQVYLRGGDFSQAAEELTLLISYNNQVGEYYLRRAIASLNLNNVLDAEDDLLRAEEFKIGDYNFGELIATARSFEKLEQFLRAANYYEKALETDRGRTFLDHEPVYQKLYELYEKVGDKENAERMKERL